MKKMMVMLLASVMAAGIFTTTAFAYTGDDVQKNTSVSTAAQEADAAESANAVVVKIPAAITLASSITIIFFIPYPPFLSHPVSGSPGWEPQPAPSE